MQIRTVSSSTAYLETTDALLNCNCAVNAINVVLNPSKQYQGEFTIKKSDSGTNEVTITPNGTETIDGASSATLVFLNDKKILIPVSGGWSVIDSSLSVYSLTVQMVDANTAGSCFVVAPFSGNIIALQAVNDIANTTVKTVLLAKIATVTITAPAWEIAITQAAGVASSVVPTAANTITAGSVIEIASDGGGTPVMPISVTLIISR